MSNKKKKVSKFQMSIMALGLVAESIALAISVRQLIIDYKLMKVKYTGFDGCPIGCEYEACSLKNPVCPNVEVCMLHAQKLKKEENVPGFATECEEAFQKAVANAVTELIKAE